MIRGPPGFTDPADPELDGATAGALTPAAPLPCLTDRVLGAPPKIRGTSDESAAVHSGRFVCSAWLRCGVRLLPGHQPFEARVAQLAMLTRLS